MLNQIIWSLVLAIFAAGCAVGTPIVRMEQDISPAAYPFVEVSPVSNDTGQTFEFDVADMLTQETLGEHFSSLTSYETISYNIFLLGVNGSDKDISRFKLAN